jgi:hypothetical protein
VGQRLSPDDRIDRCFRMSFSRIAQYCRSIPSHGSRVWSFRLQRSSIDMFPSRNWFPTPKFGEESVPWLRSEKTSQLGHLKER